MKQDNLQPNLENGLKVSKKVQRLTGEDPTNKPDTSSPHPIKLKCSECKEKKEEKDFYISTKNIKRGFDYRCKECCKKRTVAYHYENRGKILKKWKTKRDTLTLEQKEEIAKKNQEWRRTDIRKRLLWRAKERSNRINVFCNLELEDIIIPEKCPLLEEKFVYGSTHNKWMTYSIDRIDNSKGYVKGNIQVITYLANTMKSKATKEQLVVFAKNILKLFKDDDIV